MNRLTPKSVARWPTLTIPRCLCRHSVLGCSACSWRSSFRAQTSSSSSDTLLSTSPRFVSVSFILLSFLCFLLLNQVSRRVKHQARPPPSVFPHGQAVGSLRAEGSLFGISLNPGPFTVKEHVIITIMSGVGSTPAYAVSETPVSRIVSTPSHPYYPDRRHCRPKGPLQTTPKLWLSVSFFGLANDFHLCS
jgi:hypothetical protein